MTIQEGTARLGTVFYALITVGPILLSLLISCFFIYRRKPRTGFLGGLAVILVLLLFMEWWVYCSAPDYGVWGRGGEWLGLDMFFYFAIADIDVLVFSVLYWGVARIYGWFASRNKS